MSLTELLQGESDEIMVQDHLHGSIGQQPIKSNIYNTPKELLDHQSGFLSKTLAEYNELQRKLKIKQRLDA